MAVRRTISGRLEPSRGASRPVLEPRLRLGQDLLDLSHVVLEVADDEPLRHRLDGELAAGRVEAASRQLRRSQGAPAPIEALEGSRRSGRTAPAAAPTGRARRGRCARRRWRSGRTARAPGRPPGPARSRPASTGPSRRGGRAPRPAPSGLHPSRRRSRRAATAPRPRRRVVWRQGRLWQRPDGPAGRPWAPVWHARGSMDGHRHRPAAASATDRPADSRGDPR